ncbi:MAG: transglutaminase-like domain-containing protein [Desulfatiglandaceae bacterium]
MKIRIVLFAALAVLIISTGAFGGIPSGTVTFNIQPSVLENSKDARLWMPYPLSDEYQLISNVQVSGNYNVSGVYKDPDSGAVYYYAEWNPVKAQPFLVMSFHVELKDRKVVNMKDSKEPVPVIIKKDLESTEWVPSKDFKDIAKKITRGKKSILQKARAVYDWTIENTYRDPDVKGCGLALPGRTLNEQKGGGKCADISAVYVSIARAAGIPARDVYGIRLADPRSGNITSEFHCWAEFYLPGTGWVPVDPADVRKMMLVHDLELKDADDWREFFWGGDDLFRIVLETDARGVTFQPKQDGQALNYFMYPFAQIDGETLNYFDPKNFVYSVSFEKD